MKLKKICLPILLFISIQILYAQVSYNQEFRINTYTSNHQDWPDICNFNDSSFIACWTSEQDDSGSSANDIYGQLFNNVGIKIGNEFRINSYTIGGQDKPNAGNLIDGGFVVSWESYGQDGDGNGIFAQICNKDGSLRGEEFQVNTYTKSYQKLQRVSGLSDGKFIICWASSEQDGSGDGVYGQIFNSDGSQYGNEFQVDTYYEFGQTSPSVSKINDDKFLIVWESYFPDERQYEIFAQMYNNNGEKLGDKFNVNSYTDKFQINPDVCYISNGNFIVCWQSATQDGSSNGIYAQLFNSTGDKIGSEISVNTYTNSSQENPSVSMLDDGKFIICWMSMNQDGDDYGIYGQLFNSDGLKLGEEFQINTYTKSYQSKPEISSISQKGFVVCWISYNQDGSHGGIYGKYYLNEPIIHNLQPFSILKPIFNLDNSTISFTWHRTNLLNINFPWELEYKIYLDKSDNFSNPQIISAIYDTIYSINNLVPGRYYWKVLAKNIAGDSLWSTEIDSFPDIHPLNPFSLYEPSYDTTLETTRSVFKWGKTSSLPLNFPWELEYKIYLDDNNDFIHPQIISEIYDTSCVVDSLIPGTTYWWKVLAKNIEGDSLWSSETNAFFVSHDATSIQYPVSNNPKDFELYSNYPNPFNPETTIKYTLPPDKSIYSVKIKIYNVLGQLINTLINEPQSPGLHKIKWNGKNTAGQNMPSGIYFCVVEAGQIKATQKILLVR